MKLLGIFTILLLVGFSPFSLRGAVSIPLKSLNSKEISALHDSSILTMLKNVSPLPFRKYPIECKKWVSFEDQFHLELLDYDLSVVDGIQSLGRFWGLEGQRIQKYSTEPFLISEEFLSLYGELYEEGLGIFFERDIGDSLYNFYLNEEWGEALKKSCSLVFAESSSKDEGEKKKAQDKIKAFKKFSSTGILFAKFEAPLKRLFDEVSSGVENRQKRWEQEKVTLEDLNKSKQNLLQTNKFSFCYIGWSLVVHSCSCEWSSGIGLEVPSSCQKLKSVSEKNKVFFSCSGEKKRKESSQDYFSVIKTWCEWASSLGKSSRFCTELETLSLEQKKSLQFNCF